MYPLSKASVSIGIFVSLSWRYTAAFSSITIKSISQGGTSSEAPTSLFKPKSACSTHRTMSKDGYDIQQPRSLRGKTALITGSSGGIGAGIAEVFARAGADVIVHYNSRRDGAVSTYERINEYYKNAASSSANDNDLPGRCLAIIQADFRDPKAVDEMFRCVLNHSLPNNRLDILVNNAGIVTKLALEDDDDSLSIWHETMAVNLHAPLQLMKLAHRHMKSTTIGSRKGGIIINNTSIHGSRSVEFMTAYAASKAALDSLTRGLACEFAEDGVRVNAIAPGVVPVERTEQAFSDPNVTNMWLPHLPSGRLGTVMDIAHATLLLATNEWMTGNVLTVDGGMMARANMPIRPKPSKPVINDKNERSVGAAGERASNIAFEVPNK